MNKSRYSDAIKNAGDALFDKHADDFKKLTLQDLDLDKLLPNPVDQKALALLINKVKLQSTNEAQLHSFEENSLGCALTVIDIARKILFKI